MVNWLNGQPSWSDFPYRAADSSGRRTGAQSGRRATRPGARQRHLHRTAVSSDHTGQRRRLRGQGPASPISDPRHSRQSHRQRGSVADRAERRPSWRARTALAGIQSSKRPIPASDFSGAGRAIRFPIRICWQPFIPMTGSGVSRCCDETIKTGGDYSIEYRNIWPDGSQHWVDVRARRGAPAGWQHQVAGRRLLRHHRAQDSRTRTRESGGATGGRAHGAGGIDCHARTAGRPTYGRVDEGGSRSREGAGATASGAEDGNDRPTYRRCRA